MRLRHRARLGPVFAVLVPSLLLASISWALQPPPIPPTQTLTRTQTLADISTHTPTATPLRAFVYLPVVAKHQSGTPTGEPLPPNTLIATVVEGLDQPIAMAFDPAGRLFVTERTGSVRLVVNGWLQPQAVIRFDVDICLERGLLGLTLDPDFSANHFVYVYYTERPGAPCGDTVNKVVRFVERNGAGSDPVQIFSSPAVWAGYHNGGNLRFGPDGKLYISVGDDTSSAIAQDLSMKNGKIHRINADGTIPTDNPWYGQANVEWSIFARGLRNSFDFDFDPVSGWLFASENGPNCDDELNRILPSYNYGWRPDYPCDDLNPDPAYNTIPPLWFLPIGECCIGPTGVAFYTGGHIPTWQNELFMCSYNWGQLHHFYLSPDRRTVTSAAQIDGIFCRMDIQTGPDGAFYYIENGGFLPGTIKRVAPSLPTDLPPMAKHR
jgi:glucose/arabinose dehydrogenase